MGKIKIVICFFSGIIISLIIGIIGLYAYNSINTKVPNEKREISINSKENSKEKEIEKDKISKNLPVTPTPKKETSQKKENTREEPKTTICDYCKKEVDRWFFYEKYTLCPPCDVIFNSSYDKCYECGKLYPLENMIADTCKTCYSQRYSE